MFIGKIKRVNRKVKFKKKCKICGEFRLNTLYSSTSVVCNVCKEEGR